MKGVYILLINLCEDSRIRIGALGLVTFRKGFYAYAGSAMGGLEARIRRHMRKEKKLHWHIDYLLEKADLEEVLVKESSLKTEECKTAGLLEYAGGTSVPGFGCSDCGCLSHLFHFGNLRKSRIPGFKLFNS